MVRLVSTLSTIWRLAAPYFRSEDRWAGRALLLAAIAAELANIIVMVLVNDWYNNFYNALQERNWDAFVKQNIYFCALAAASVVIHTYQLYLSQWLSIRWRRWMTASYIHNWLEGATHYHMQLLGDSADNPDQRIAEDVKQFTERTLALGLKLLSAGVTFCTFVAILWSLSAASPLHLSGLPIEIPGYLVWAAIAYSAIGTLLAHFIGRPLVELNFIKQRREADFRFDLIRVREHSEQIALLSGERAEARRLLGKFDNIVINWHGIMSRQKLLSFFTEGFTQASNHLSFRDCESRPISLGQFNSAV